MHTAQGIQLRRRAVPPRIPLLSPTYKSALGRICPNATDCRWEEDGGAGKGGSLMSLQPLPAETSKVRDWETRRNPVEGHSKRLHVAFQSFGHILMNLQQSVRHFCKNLILLG